MRHIHVGEWRKKHGTSQWVETKDDMQNFCDDRKIFRNLCITSSFKALISGIRRYKQLSRVKLDPRSNL